MTAIETVALIGGGVIGAGWAGRLVLNGIDVVVCDPDPEVERKVGEVVANAARAQRRLSVAPAPAAGRIRFANEVEEAVADADFVQESAPEREDLKRGLLARASRATRPDVVIASSTSGLRPSRLQADCTRPERVLVGHPFNPVYLLPLVEVCGGDETSAEVKARACAFYRSVGMHPLEVRHEIDGFIADRLLEAVWREALHMVNDGVASADEIDQAICYGPGLRWSVMGTFLIYRLAGGEAGMRHFMAQFGPALKLPWTRLEAPELTDALIERIVAQSDAQAGDRSIREYERLRDDCLVSVLQALRVHDHGAGAVLKAHEAARCETARARTLDDGDDLARPLRLHEARVAADWVDDNGHMTESRYVQVFGDGSDAFYRYIGVDSARLDRGLGYYTAESHIGHLREVAADVPLYVTTQLLAYDEKRLQLFHSLHDGRDDTRLATAEQMMLHMDTRARRTCPAPGDVLGRLERIHAAHAALPWPERAGRAIAMPRYARSVA